MKKGTRYTGYRIGIWCQNIKKLVTVNKVSLNYLKSTKDKYVTFKQKLMSTARHFEKNVQMVLFSTAVLQVQLSNFCDFFNKNDSFIIHSFMKSFYIYFIIVCYLLKKN